MKIDPYLDEYNPYDELTKDFTPEQFDQILLEDSVLDGLLRKYALEGHENFEDLALKELQAIFPD